MVKVLLHLSIVCRFWSASVFRFVVLCGTPCVSGLDRRGDHEMVHCKEAFIPNSLLEQMLAGADSRAALEPNGLLDELKKALGERALNAGDGPQLGGPERQQPLRLRQQDCADRHGADRFGNPALPARDV